MNNACLLEMKQIVKKFPGVLANDRVDLAVRAGEIHALLGENGAGKTTLMKVLYGLFQPDSGEIYVKGEKAVIRSPKDAIRLGIGMVHQHFTLVPTMTVTQNMILGLESTRGPFLDTKRAEEKVAELSKKYGLHVDPGARVWQLSVGEQQRVEIMKALYREAKILILDEPTAVLTPPEADELMNVLRNMAADGSAIVFITHKLPEVFGVADRVTVLKSGRVVGTVVAKLSDERTLAKMMVGRDILFSVSKPQVEEGEEVLVVEDLWALGDKGSAALKGVSFSVRSGEIFGVAGVSGNGQSELAEVVTGLRKASRGKVYVLGKDATNRSPREIKKLGVGHIPEDRIGTGLVMSFSVRENLVLETFDKKPFARNWILDKKEMSQYAERMMAEFQISAPSADTSTRTLSGGNLQRLILARELSGKRKLLIACKPTRGLDIGATEYIRKKLVEQRTNSLAILLISEDLDEVMSISDRIAVFCGGKIMGIVPAKEAKDEEIGLMMTGREYSSLPQK